MRKRLVLVILGCIMAQPVPASAQEPAKSVHQFQVTDIDGKKVELSRYKGKVLLIVNVASECGYTPQYEGLQALYAKHGKDGLAILAFPCNDFGKQEPGTDTQVKNFACNTYKAEFDLFSKIRVLGKDASPLYQFLTSTKGKSGPVRWNFEKFLIGRDGQVVARFASDVEPLGDALQNKLRDELGRK